MIEPGFDSSVVIDWEQDYAIRMNPKLVTKLLRDAVPIVKRIDYQVLDVAEGYCRSLLPLNFESTNQHGTHQAALMSIAADYTGGIALASLLRGVRIGGVHPGSDDNSAALWLASMQVKYFAPSTGHLAVECRIDKQDCDSIQTRYFAGRRVMARLDVNFYSNDERVASAEMVYFAQPATQLQANGRNRVSKLLEHKLKASARMIAGLRGGLGGDSEVTNNVHCAHSKAVAGPHGALLAKRLNAKLPQLQDMVLARTKHIDDKLRNALRNGLSQVVLLGVGLDVRAFGYGPEASGATFFEVDLPEMLAERDRVISGLRVPVINRRLVPMNFELQRLEHVLEVTPEFDPRLPTAFIYEGCSMYFSEKTNNAMLSSIAKLMSHEQSFLWVDFVAESVVRGVSKNDDVREFLKGMEELGEAFIFGVDDPEAYLHELGFAEVELVSASDFFHATDPIFSLYRFALARRPHKTSEPNRSR